jgi:hypothetical protein
MIKNMADPPKERKCKTGFVPPDARIFFESATPRQLKITIPCCPPSKNDYGKRQGHETHKKWFAPWTRWFCEHARRHANAYGLVIFPGKVVINLCVHYPRKGRQDRLNVLGFPPLMDALVESGILIDDSDDVITRMQLQTGSVIAPRGSTVIVIAEEVSDGTPSA